MEFFNGVKRIYIYIYFFVNFRYNIMLVGFCNLCDEFGYVNYDKFVIFFNDVERVIVIFLRDIKGKVIRY